MDILGIRFVLRTGLCHRCPHRRDSRSRARRRSKFPSALPDPLRTKVERVLLPSLTGDHVRCTALAQVTESDQSLGGKHVFASPRSRSGGEIKGAIVFEFPPRREGCDSGMEAFSHPNRVSFYAIDEWFEFGIPDVLPSECSL